MPCKATEYPQRGMGKATNNVQCYVAYLLRFVPWDRIVNKSILVKVKAWGRTGDKPLPEPMMIKIYSIMWRHWTVYG